jgi:hypothetical protein
MSGQEEKNDMPRVIDDETRITALTRAASLLLARAVQADKTAEQGTLVCDEKTVRDMSEAERQVGTAERIEVSALYTRAERAKDVKLAAMRPSSKKVEPMVPANDYEELAGMTLSPRDSKRVREFIDKCNLDEVRATPGSSRFVTYPTSYPISPTVRIDTPKSRLKR